MPQYTKVYHLSPHANIQYFRGHYSSKIGARGLFVSQSWESILNDWMDTLLGKRFGGRKPSTTLKRRKRWQRELDIYEESSDYDEKSPKYQALDRKIKRAWRGSDRGTYQSITIYHLLIPQEIFQICQQKMEELTEVAFSKLGAGALGSWSWGIEVFIFEEYLDQIQIIGRETLPMRKALALGRKNRQIQAVHRDNIYRKMEQYRKEIFRLIEKFGKAPLLDRALRYTHNFTSVDLKNTSRHYQVIEDLIAPYQRQEKPRKNPEMDRQCEAKEKDIDGRIRRCMALPLGIGNMSMHDYCLKCSKNLCDRHMKSRCPRGGHHQPSSTESEAYGDAHRQEKMDRESWADERQNEAEAIKKQKKSNSDEFRHNPNNTTLKNLLKLRKELVKAAQYIYDEWNQDSEGFDEHWGEGGICDFIAEDWQKILKNYGIKSTFGSTPWDKGDHQFLIVKTVEGNFKIDLPFNKYEKLKKVRTGWLRGQKHYFKKLGVRFKINDITIKKV